MTIHPLIEFGNRLLTGVLVIVAVAVLILVASDRARSKAYRRWSVVPLAGVMMQAVIGGVTVLLDLSPAWVGVHYLVSAVLVWVSMMMLSRYTEGDGPVVVLHPWLRRIAWWVTCAMVPMVALGVVVTGSGPHGGDDQVASRFPFDPVAVTRLHSLSTWLFVALVIVFTVVAVRYVRSGDDAARPSVRAAVVLVVVTFSQGAIGYTQYLTGLPIVLVGLHMAGSAVLMASVARLVCATRVRN